MSTRPRPQIAPRQRLSLRPGLTSSLRVLSHDAFGLSRYLAEQAAQNPLLKLEAPDPPVSEWLPRWSMLFAPAAAERAEPESLAAAGPSLAAHVSDALNRMGLTSRERRIALVLILALEPTGWLGQPIDSLAEEAEATVSEAEAVLRRLQTRIEPAGLFARTLAECLTLQAREAGQLDTVMAMVLAHLDVLARGDIAALARLAGTDPGAIRARVGQIRGYDPKPGLRFDPVNASVREPDLIARRGPQGWEVSLNRGALPSLRIEVPKGSVAARTAETRAHLAEARLLRRMVEARGRTLLAVGREVLTRQAAALEQGRTALVPLTRTEIAAAMGLHDSTISRAVAGTSVDTPRGTWWLADLFAARLGEGADAVSSGALRARLAQLVAAENPAAPLSDRALAEALGQASGTVPARRTIAKYRDMLQIPPARLRRRAR